MVYRGHVKNGMVVLDDPCLLPEGAAVQIHVIPSAEPDAGVAEAPSLYERLKSVVGQAQGLPPDASVNHDHYLYGVPKK